MLIFIISFVFQAIVEAAEVEEAVDVTEIQGTLVTAAEVEVEDGQLLTDGIMAEEEIRVGPTPDQGEGTPTIVGVVAPGAAKGEGHDLLLFCLFPMLMKPTCVLKRAGKLSLEKNTYSPVMI